MAAFSSYLNYSISPTGLYHGRRPANALHMALLQESKMLTEINFQLALARVRGHTCQLETSLTTPKEVAALGSWPPLTNRRDLHDVINGAHIRLRRLFQKK